MVHLVYLYLAYICLYPTVHVFFVTKKRNATQRNHCVSLLIDTTWSKALL